MVFQAKLTPFRCFLVIFLNLAAIIIFVSALLNDITDSPVHAAYHNERDDAVPFPGRELHHLHWFVQVSDIHVSIFYDKQRAPDLKIFVQKYLNEMIKPEVVLVTGDLTDAKYLDKIGSSQFEEEWKIYADVIRSTGVMNKTVWLDMRGNHDVFSVPDATAPENFYRRYSVQGREHPSHYMYQHKTSDGNTYSFIAVDSCPKPGPRRPFNFFGVLTKDDLTTLRRYREEARGSNKTIWFGHYPSSTVHAPHPGFRSILGGDIHFFGHLHQLGGTMTELYLRTDQGNLELELADWMESRITGPVYMCGHLHSMLDFVPNMQAPMHENYLELEVGDWKDYRNEAYLCGHLHTFLDTCRRMQVRRLSYMELELGDWMNNRVFRVFAVDHDLFSFTDEVYGRLPIILITNPKNAYFNQPAEEPIGRIRRSTHIRILVFSPGDIRSVSVSLNGLQIGEAEHSEGPLYVLPWRPESYLRGVHYIAVTVKDSLGNDRTVKQPFSLDSTKIPFDVMPRYLLMFDHIFFLRCLFVGAVLMTSLPLILFRFLNLQIETRYGGESCRGCLSRFVLTWIRRLYLLSHTDQLFYPLLLFLFYVCLGPWFIGEIMQGHIGAMFVYGIYVYGQYIPGTLTYLYGFSQLITFNFPLTLYLARVLDLTLSEHKHPTGSEMKTLYRGTRWLLDHGFFIVLLLWQLHLAYYGFYKAYGLLAFLLCPVRTWALPLAVYLRSVALRQGVATQQANGDHERVRVEFEVEGDSGRVHSC